MATRDPDPPGDWRLVALWPIVFGVGVLGALWGRLRHAVGRALLCTGVACIEASDRLLPPVVIPDGLAHGCQPRDALDWALDGGPDDAEAQP